MTATFFEHTRAIDSIAAYASFVSLILAVPVMIGVAGTKKEKWHLFVAFVLFFLSLKCYKTVCLMKTNACTALTLCKLPVASAISCPACAFS